MVSFSLIISVGPWGGFYIQNGDAQKRICLGWFAFTLIVPEYDEVMKKAMNTVGYL